MPAKILVTLVSTMFLAGVASHADEQIRRVQEELRKRNLYFGEIDGRNSKQVAGALRRYQQQKGFTPTGECDANTLRALQIVASAEGSGEGSAGDESLPDVPVLKSDAAREVAEADRKLLEKLEGAEPAAVGEPPGDVEFVEPPDELLPPPLAPESAPAAPPAPPSAPEPASDPAPVPQSQITPPKPEPAPRKSTPPRQTSKQVRPAPEAVAKQAESFVRDYLATCESSKMDAELGYYADRVNYFDHGTVSREFIEKDVLRYRKRWPSRDYQLLDLDVAEVGENDLQVKFRIAYQVKSPEHKASGRTLNTFRIRRAGDEMRLVALKEQRVRK